MFVVEDGLGVVAVSSSDESEHAVGFVIN